MIDALSSFGAVAVFIGVCAWLAATRPYVLVALLWLLIPMGWRLMSSLYIDVSGPEFSEQLRQHVGPGNATPLLALDFLIVLGIFAGMLPRRFAVDRLGSEAKHKLIADAAFWAALGLLIALYVDLMRIGSIPFLSGIERYDYAREHAGQLYRLFFRFGDVIALCLGGLYVLPACFGRSPDSRFAYLLLAMLVYAFLTGHRYSAFFKFCTLFVVPCALLFTLRNVSEIIGRRWLAVVVLVAVVSLIGSYALFHSYFSMRFDDRDDALTSLKHRLLVQQAELWWLTYQRVVEGGLWDVAVARDFLFSNAIDPGRNTTIQYLMYLAIGGEAIALLDVGQQYAGGFPEMEHELFGVPGGVLAVAAFTIAPAWLLRTLLRELARGRFLTAAWAGTVLYPFAIMYWGGMLNFVLAWSFWLKVTGLALALLSGYIAAWKPLAKSPSLSS